MQDGTTASEVQPPGQAPSNEAIRQTDAATGLFIVLLMLGAGCVVLVTWVLVMRGRGYRQKVETVMGLNPPRPTNADPEPRVDPWLESARRMTMPPGAEADDDDTVDLDPGDLGPDDIEPRGGKGRR